ncbi:MAG TPA: HAD family hydrolase [Gemmataceae bacterium]|nr:HAD family hydrolase [Gemmataceae bacterium]
MRPALFLDRDGTLIEDVSYPRDPDRVRLLPGAAGALRRLARAGFALVIVSNQSGVGRGLFSRAEAEAVHAEVMRRFAEVGVVFDGAYYCYHAPDEGCDCRKPAPGLLVRAAAELGLDPGRSLMVGDKPIDVEAGAAAGCRGVLLGAGAADWEEVVRFVQG